MLVPEPPAVVARYTSTLPPLAEPVGCPPMKRRWVPALLVPLAGAMLPPMRCSVSTHEW